jgi:hypothetical protein
VFQKRQEKQASVFRPEFEIRARIAGRPELAANVENLNLMLTVPIRLLYKGEGFSRPSQLRSPSVATRQRSIVASSGVMRPRRGSADSNFSPSGAGFACERLGRRSGDLPAFSRVS